MIVVAKFFMRGFMKIFFTFIVLISVSSSYAASITVQPFKIKFLINTNEYELDFKLQMACRYEKFVIGDSSEYEYKFKDVPLLLKAQKINSEISEITFENKVQRELEVKGFFKPNKACQTITEFFIKSKLYSIGWANQYNRAIKLGIYKQSRLSEVQYFDSKVYNDLFSYKELGFIYNNRSSQTYVKFAIDAVAYDSMSTFARIMVPLDPNTNKPYLLKK